MNTLEDHWHCYLAEEVPITTPEAEVRAIRRRFMAGALAAVQCVLRGDRSTPMALQAELVAYGRTVGTGLEVAR